MCNPTLLLIGSMVQGVGAMNQMQAQADSYDAQADLSTKQGRDALVVGKHRAKRAEDDARRVGGQQRAAFAEGGLDVSSGSAYEVQQASAQEADLDIAAILWSTNAEMDSKKYESGIYKQNAKSARAAAPMAFLSPILKQAPNFISAWGS